MADAALLWVVVALIASTALAHSWLGERYLLRRLFRRAELPNLFGGPEFTRDTLRFAWHITTVSWLGLAALIALFALDAASRTNVLATLALTTALCAVVAGFGSRFRHLSWLVFTVITALLGWVALA